MLPFVIKESRTNSLEGRAESHRKLFRGFEIYKELSVFAWLDFRIAIDLSMLVIPPTVFSLFKQVML